MEYLVENNESGYIDGERQMDIARFLRSQKNIAVAVIGDVCLDLAYQVTTEGAEVSVETGLQTFSVLSSKPELGGACNVAVNCMTLGADTVDLYGIIGNDFFGDLILSMLSRKRIGIESVVRQDEQWSSHVYHKVFEKGKEHPRFDSGNFNVPQRHTLDTLLDRFRSKLYTYDVIIINEQVPKGLHSPEFQQLLNQLIAECDPSILWFADCRKLNDSYKRTIHKLNEQEGRALFGCPCTLERGELARWLLSYFQKPVILTLGPDGAIAVDEQAITEIPGIHFTGQIDSVGAGDAFLAGLAIASCRGANTAQAAYIGNLCAGVSLTVLYECGHPTVEEVERLARNADWRYHPQIAEDSRRATYWDNSPIEIIAPRHMAAFPAIAIFDHDGTISTLRQGWEAVMESSMMCAIAGDAYSRLSPHHLDMLTEEIRQFIDRTTGIQTIEQMHHLVQMVRRHGLVNDSQILTPQEYKALYNEELLKMVSRKVKEIKEGRLDTSDVTLKGSVAFLRYLAERKVKLFLASGTDTADVRAEAELLGYADCFEGRIFGSVGDVANDPKRVVIKQIIENEVGGDPSRCIVFGDGPVEMREAKRHGLIAIGLASDEVRRYGDNPKKRKRLILGGADLLLPDFSYADELARCLGWEG